MTSRRTPLSLAFIGAGCAANALARAAARRGYIISGFCSNTIVNARAAAKFIKKIDSKQKTASFGNIQDIAGAADVIIIAVPDRAISSVAESLASFVTKNQIVCHVSGAKGSDALAACGRRGAAVASFHPLQTFPDRASGEFKIPGTYVTIEGRGAAQGVLIQIARKLKMLPIVIPAADRSLYHASAVLASNAVVALFDHAVVVFTKATGQPRDVAAKALWPLLAGTTDNLAKIGLPGALSGPVARGDSETIAGHLKTLANDPRALAVYRMLNLHAVDLALAKGSITNAGAAQLRSLLK
ncbi:MAG: Rossmann-like and DUF2520 domain-containing protein [Planctomycetota bacterium]